MKKDFLEKEFATGKSCHQIAKENNVSFTTVQYWKNKYKLNSLHFNFAVKKGTAKHNKYTKEEIETAVSKSNCISEVFRNLGLKVNGGSYKWIRKLIKNYNIDTKHFHSTNLNLKRAAKKELERRREQKYQDKNISTNYRLPAKVLRSFLFFWNIKEECLSCGLTHWEGQPIRLDIDHKNDDPLDNRLENLQFLCPNCHRLKTIKIK